jgi:hypothetical protein
MAKDRIRAKDIPAHSLLERLGKSDRGADAVPFWGYVGPASGAGLVALYPSLETAGDSVEIAEADVVEVADAPETVLLFGGKVIWVRRDATITRRRVEILDTTAPQPAAVELRKGRLRMRLKPRAAENDCTTPCSTCSSPCSVCQCVCRYVPPPPEML